jgi:hypothetical protein
MAISADQPSNAARKPEALDHKLVEKSGVDVIVCSITGVRLWDGIGNRKSPGSRGSKILCLRAGGTVASRAISK